MSINNNFALLFTTIENELKANAPYELVFPHEPFFWVKRFKITEDIFKSFEISLEVESESPAVDLQYLIGKEAQLVLNIHPDPRYFHGVIGKASQGDTYVTPEGHYFTKYELKLYPHWWFLQFNKDYRIFQNQTTLDIVETLLSEHQIQYYTFPRQTNNYVRPYCVQYGESAYDFISRLLEEDGIYYYFAHGPSAHEMILATAAEDQLPCLYAEGVTIAKSQSAGLNLNNINSFKIEAASGPTLFAQVGYDYNHPSYPVQSQAMGQQSKGGRVLSYTGVSADPAVAEHKTFTQQEAADTQKQHVSGFGFLPYFSAGQYFYLVGHANETLNGQAFTIEHVLHEGSNDGNAQNVKSTFKGFNHMMPYRPQQKTPKPRIHGTQTGFVIGPPGEEVWTDSMCRVQVRFVWDQYREEEQLIQPVPHSFEAPSNEEWEEEPVGEAYEEY